MDGWMDDWMNDGCIKWMPMDAIGCNRYIQGMKWMYKMDTMDAMDTVDIYIYIYMRDEVDV
jgi:hypothetical protein